MEESKKILLKVKHPTHQHQDQNTNKPDDRQTPPPRPEAETPTDEKPRTTAANIQRYIYILMKTKILTGRRNRREPPPTAEIVGGKQNVYYQRKPTKRVSTGN